MPVLGNILNTSSVMSGIIVSSPTPNATVTLTLTDTESPEMFRWTAGEAETVNISGSHSAGKLLFLKVGNDAILGRVITLGSAFVGGAAGIFTGVISKSSQLLFISDGTKFYEVTRTIGI